MLPKISKSGGINGVPGLPPFHTFIIFFFLVQPNQLEGFGKRRVNALTLVLDRFCYIWWSNQSRGYPY